MGLIHGTSLIHSTQDVNKQNKAQQTKMISNTGLHQTPGVNRRITPGVNRRVTPGVNRRVTPGVNRRVTPGVNRRITLTAKHLG